MTMLPSDPECATIPEAHEQPSYSQATWEIDLTPRIDSGQTLSTPWAQLSDDLTHEIFLPNAPSGPTITAYSLTGSVLSVTVGPGLIPGHKYTLDVNAHRNDGQETPAYLKLVCLR